MFTSIHTWFIIKIYIYEYLCGSGSRNSSESTACERDECSFIFVQPVARLAAPRAEIKKEHTQICR